MPGGVRGGQPQGVGGEQPQDREADSLLLEQLRAGGPGQRQGEVLDPKRDQLGGADRGEFATAIAQPEPGEPGRPVDLDRPGHLLGIGALGAGRASR